MSLGVYFAHLFTTTAHIGSDPSDYSDLRLQKQILVLFTAWLLPVAFLWGILYIALNKPFAALVPLGYTLLSIISLFIFARSHHFPLFRFIQFLMILLGPFLLMLILGGYINSSAVIFWSLFCPLLALLLSTPSAALLWFGLYLLLICIGGSVQSVMQTTTPLTLTTIQLFFAMNIGGVAIIAFSLLYAFAGFDESLRFQNRSLTIITSLLVIPGALWSALYLTMGQPLAAIVPITYTVLSSGSVFVFTLLGRSTLLRATQLILTLIGPFVLMLFLGGITDPSAVIFWSLFCPLFALLLSDRRSAANWFFLFLLLLMLGIFLQLPRLSNTPLPIVATRLFFIMNVGAASSLIFFLLYFYIGQKNVVQAFILPSIQGLEILLVRKNKLVQLMGERVPASVAKYVVPFEANTKYIGTEFVKDLARNKGGEFKRNQPGIGIVGSMKTLHGPFFDEAQLDPLIQEFYEHTSHFTLTIRPEWKRRIKPLFWLFKHLLAESMGQANLPFNAEEVQHGVVSYIDTINFQSNDIIDLRGWVRSYKDSGQAIYVGIYTTMRHEDIGYVSVGFPLPQANFTATLLPYNQAHGAFLLKTRNTGLSFPGHYLTEIDVDGNLTIVKLPTFGEELYVYVKEGHLRADHRFYLADLNFLTLYYTIERIQVQ